MKINKLQLLHDLFSEAIMLSADQKADPILIDEAKGRQAARQMNLKITGTIGILMAALDENLLTNRDAVIAIDTLRESGRYIGGQLYRTLMDHIHSSN